MMTRSQLHYISQPSQSKKYEGYGSYFYPEGQIKTRKIREEDIMTHINKIIFKKNTKKDECLIYLFQKDENNELLKHRNEVLENINPGKWLTVFCVQFYDYFTFDDDGLNFEGIENKSFEEKSQPSERSESIPTEQESSSPNVHNRSANLTKTIKMTAQKSSCLVSKFTLCIFTYFPLVSLMEQILISIVDEIK